MVNIAVSRKKNQIWMLYRDPVARIKSFYRDAFHTHPKRMLNERESLQSNYWRASQRLFFPHLGLSNQSDDTEISETLTSTSFEAMVSGLRKIWWKDAHLAPQVFQLYFKYKALAFSIKPDIYLDIENPDTALQLSTKDIDVSKKKNCSEAKTDLVVKPESLVVLKTIYSEDFQRFNL